jgi:hypothetical protein
VNRGNQTSSATTVEGFIVLPAFDGNGNTIYAPPTATTTPYASVPLAALAPGATATVSFTVAENDTFEDFGVLVSELSTAMFVRTHPPSNEVAGGSSNDLVGPFMFREHVGLGPIFTIGGNTDSGEITGVTPSNPTEGQDVTVSFVTQANPCSASVVARVYRDQVSAPTSATAFDAPAHAYPAGGGGCSVGFAHVLSAVQKPDNVNDALSVRVFLDATNAITENDETDNQLPSVASAFPLVVQNTPPAFTSTPLLTATEDSTYNYNATTDVQVTDVNVVDRARQTLALVSGPAGMALGTVTTSGNNKRASLTWTPTDAQAAAGTQSVTLRSCDGDKKIGGAGACTDQTYSIAVTRVNDPPVVTSTPANPIAATEDSVASYTMTATDEEGAPLTFSVVTPPPGSGVNAMTATALSSTSARFDWTPGDSGIGAQSALVRVTDGVNVVTQTINFSVSNINDAPALAAPTSTSGTQGTAFSATLAIGDADVDISGIAQTFTCSLVGAPAWVSVSTVNTAPRHCTLTGTPQNADTGANNFTVRVTDNGTPNLSGTRAVTINVANVNDPPTLGAPSATSATQGSLFSATLNVSDADLSAPGATESFTFFKDVGPAAMTLVPSASSVALAWTPAPSDVNPAAHAVTIRVRDSGGLESTQSFSVTVANINDAPVLTRPSDATINEGQSFSTTLVATDADIAAGLSDTLTFSIVSGAPAGMTVNGATGVLSLGTTNDAQVGVFNVTVRVRDTANTGSDQTFKLTVVNVEEPPVLNAIANESTNEDALYNRTALATDPDPGATITYSLTTPPAGMTIGATSGVIAWTPANADVGAHTITVVATDNTSRTSTINYTLTVINTEDAPVISSTPVTAVAQDALYSYTLVATDPDVGDVVVKSVTSALPAWLTFNAASGLLTGTPHNADVGSVSVTLRATDGTLAVTQTFTITVSNVNDPPLLAHIGNQTVNENSDLDFTLSASDVDIPAQTLTFSATGLPTGATLNASTGAFHWHATTADIGNHSVTLKVSDGIATAQETINIAVGNVNDPPVLNAIGDKSVNEGVALAFTISASDPDGTTPTLNAVGLAGSDPFTRGATFNATTGAFAWTPGFSDAGVWFVTFSASDTEFTDTELVQITVVDVNRNPSITSVAPTSTNEDAVFTYNATGTDADGDTLAWSLTVKPAGMVVNGGTGVVTWNKPLQADVGPHAVTLSLSDGKGGTATQSFTLTVINVNDAPVFSSSPPLTATEHAAYSYTASATDEDPGTTLTFTAPTKPAWLSFDAPTHTLSGTPAQTDAGNASVVVRVSDGIVSVDQSFTIVVTAVNDPPVFGAPTPSGTVNGAESSLLTFTLAATDPDSPTITYSMTGQPSGSTLNASTGVFAWTPSFTDAGTRNVTLVASDGSLQATRALTIVIANTDRAPTITAPATQTVAEGVLLSFAVSAADPDGDAVTITLTSGPAGASFDGTTFSFTPNFSQSGTATASFRATAGALTANTNTTITITDTNRAPVVTSTPPTSTNEDALLTYAVLANDPDGDPVTFALATGPSGAVINASSGVLTFTPVQAQVGTRAFDILVSDNRGGSVHQVFNLTVINVNDAPVIASAPVTTATQGAPYAYTVLATDEDGDPLTFSLTTAPTGMSINASSGAISYLPSNADVGAHTVVAKVDDGHGGVATQSFTVTVINVNDPPVFASNPAPATAVSQGATFSFTPVVTDVDVGDVVTLSLVSPPSGMTLSTPANGGTVSWTPGNDDVGAHTIRIRARDIPGATTDLVFTLTVVNVNDAPFFTSPPINTTVLEGSTFSAPVVASDIDLGDVLTYSFVGGHDRATVDSVTGQLVFHPDDPDTLAPVTFTIRVDDLAGAFAEQSAHFTVTPVDDPPVLAPIADVQAAFNTTVTITLSATDPDGPTLVFIATSGDGSALPAGAALTGNVFTWPVTASDAGAHVIAFKASDSILVDEQLVTIVVGDGGLPPVIHVPADANVDEGVLVSATITASDPQGGAAPAVSAGTLPDGASFTSATGAFAWTPLFDQAGDYTITFSAASGSGVTNRDWHIHVGDVDRAPVLVTAPALTANEGVLYSSQIVATDPDGDAITFTLESGPTGLVVSASGLVTWTPQFVDVGVRTFTVRIDDGRGGVAEPSFNIGVIARDDDHDGLPDTWEVLFGTDPTRNDASEDPDGDGLTNLQEFLAGKDPFVSNAPSTPVLVAPADHARSDTATPAFSWQRSLDPDGDAVSYELRVAPADDAGDVVISELVPDLGDALVSFTSTTVLDENRHYTWSVRATDGIGFSAPVARDVLIDVVNEPAPAPNLVSPPSDSTVATQHPTLRIDPVVDPDDEPVTYRFRVREAPEADPTFESDFIAAPAIGTVSVVVSEALPDGTRWFWEAQAKDSRGLLGAVGGPQAFTIDLNNQPPSAPAVLSPSDGETVSTTDVTLRFAASVDPEGAAVTDPISVSQSPTFDAAARLDFGPLSASNGFVDVQLHDLAQGAVYWRASASDGAAVSDVAEGSFSVDSVDDPPAAPTLLSPADNALIDGGTVLVAVAMTDDPEGGPVTTHIEVLDGSGAVVTSVDGVDDVDDGTVDEIAHATFVLDDGLYGWRARIDEPDGVVSAFSATSHFRVAHGNARPAAPVLREPSEGAVVTTATPVFRFDEAVDPEGDPVTHDIDVTVNGVLAFSAQGLRANAGVVEVTPASPLPSGAVVWTVRARDLGGPGDPAVGHFTIDAIVDVDAGTPDGGTGDDGGTLVDGGTLPVDGGPDDLPVTADIGGSPLRPLSPSCGCTSSSPAEQVGFAAFGATLLAVGRRRRR